MNPVFTVYARNSPVCLSRYGILRLQGINTANMYRIRRIWQTSIFQGAGKKRRYFEGWYFKHVSLDGRVFAVIPGVSLSVDGLKKHAFIQTIDGNTAETHYLTFPFEVFSFSKDRFFVRIGDNYFSKEGIEVDLQDQDYRFSARCAYRGARGMPFSLINPNAMGWYAFVPFMECYHGLVSMDHEIEGFFDVNGSHLSFNRGRGYIEKDWGRSFPSSWVWMQTNCFSRTDGSFMLSIARIPWLGSHFVGFLGFVLISGKVYKFATYTGARLQYLRITESEVETVIDTGKHTLFVTGRKKKKGVLQAPINGVMERRILESIDAEITIEMKDNAKHILFGDTGTHGGLEIVGNPEELVSGVNEKSGRRNAGR